MLYVAVIVKFIMYASQININSKEELARRKGHLSIVTKVHVSLLKTKLGKLLLSNYYCSFNSGFRCMRWSLPITWLWFVMLQEIIYNSMR